jgi:hypothetical protein
MTKVLNVTRNGEGQFEITDASGHLVDGPYETNSAAWSALDRLDNESYNGLSRKRKPKKKAKGGKGNNPPKPSKAKVERKMQREAAKAPGWVRSIAAAKFDPQANRQFRDYKLGTLGPASEVKRIDPAVYLAEKAAKEGRA